MGRNIKIDYGTIPSQSSNIKELGQGINGKLVEVYNKVAQMHDNWYGKSYNHLVENFNTLVNQMNQYLKVVIVDVPYTLSLISNDFSTIDIEQSATVAYEENVNEITAIPVTEDVGMRYISDAVAVAQNEILSDIRSAYEMAENIEGTVDQVELETSATSEFRTSFGQLSNAFKQMLNQLDTQFAGLMEQTRAQIEGAEEANTVE